MKTLFILVIALTVTACNSNPHHQDYNRLINDGCGITYDCVVTGDNDNQQASNLIIQKLILNNKL